MNSLSLNRPHYTNLDGELIDDRESIPAKVQEFFVKNRTRDIKIVEDKGVLWIASKLDVKRIDLNKYKNFEICFMTKAKGGGFVAIQAWPKKKNEGCVNILNFGNYSDNALESAKEISNELGNILGYKLEVADWGADY